MIGGDSIHKPCQAGDHGQGSEQKTRINLTYEHLELGGIQMQLPAQRFRTSTQGTTAFWVVSCCSKECFIWLKMAVSRHNIVECHVHRKIPVLEKSRLVLL